MVLVFVFNFFLMVGILFLVGFCVKFYVFFVVLSLFLYFFVVMVLFSSIVSCFYYLRFIKFMYFYKEVSFLVMFMIMDE